MHLDPNSRLKLVGGYSFIRYNGDSKGKLLVRGIGDDLKMKDREFPYVSWGANGPLLVLGDRNTILDNGSFDQANFGLHLFEHGQFDRLTPEMHVSLIANQSALYDALVVLEIRGDISREDLLSINKLIGKVVSVEPISTSARNLESITPGM